MTARRPWYAVRLSIAGVPVYAYDSRTGERSGRAPRFADYPLPWTRDGGRRQRALREE